MNTTINGVTIDNIKLNILKNKIRNKLSEIKFNANNKKYHTRKLEEHEIEEIVNILLNFREYVDNWFFSSKDILSFRIDLSDDFNIRNIEELIYFGYSDLDNRLEKFLHQKDGIAFDINYNLFSTDKTLELLTIYQKIQYILDNLETSGYFEELTSLHKFVIEKYQFNKKEFYEYLAIKFNSINNYKDICQIEILPMHDQAIFHLNLFGDKFKKLQDELLQNLIKEFYRYNFEVSGEYNYLEVLRLLFNVYIKINISFFLKEKYNLEEKVNGIYEISKLIVETHNLNEIVDKF